ncbi:MAG: DUF1620 super [Phylliscum demangeonii]|nr:MAG: DUF1620 super [Phylliscum demangeonii]
MNSLGHSLLLLSAIFAFTDAIFQDEAYHTDFHYPLLGLPDEHTTFFHRPASSPSTYIYTLSEKHVVAAVNPKDGTAVWRQCLTPPTNSSSAFLRAGEGENTVISAAGGEVRAWDAQSGQGVWANEFGDGEVRDLEVLALEDRASGKGAKDAIVLFGSEGHASVRRLDGITGDVVSVSPSNVYAIFLHHTGTVGYKIKIISLDPLTGKETDHYTLSSDGEVSDPGSIVFVGANAASPIIAWTDKRQKALRINVLGSKTVHSFKVASRGEEEPVKISIHAPHLVKSLPHFLVHYQTAEAQWADVYHINIAASKITKAYDLPRLNGPGVFSTSNVDANVYFTRITDTEVTLVSSAAPDILGQWKTAMPELRGLDNQLVASHPVFVVSDVVSKGDSIYNVRSAVLASSGDWLLIRNGEMLWLRAEALAGVVAAEFADGGAGPASADNLRVEARSNILLSYLRRTLRHLNELRDVLAELRRLQERMAGLLTAKAPGTTSMVDAQTDKFGFHKLVILATENGRIYALDAGEQGRIAWTVQGANLRPGEKWDVKRIAHILDAYDHGHRDHDPSAHALLGQRIVVVRGPDDVIRGWSVPPQDSRTVEPSPAWEFAPGPGERIAAVTCRPDPDPVASIGRVLGDRSVLYKYLNPNLLLVTVVHDGAGRATFHLLDGVSGRLLHSVSQAGIDPGQAISVAMSENWFVYSFWGDSTTNATATGSPSTAPSLPAIKGYQVVIAELYESTSANDRGPLGSAANFSSFHSSASASASASGEAAARDPLQPRVLSQAFFIPEPITQLTTTQTQQGISSRAILAFLPHSHALIAIPRAVLDARRPLDRDPTAAERDEEGLVRRLPTLDFDPKWMVSHARDVHRVRRILAAPTLLESTSVVFAYGLDLFGTRVAPSLAFDVLGRAFAKAQLLLTVCALALGTMLLAPMVRTRQTNAQWQVT